MFYPYAVTYLQEEQKFYATKVMGNNFKNTGSILLRNSEDDNIVSTFFVPTIALSEIDDFEKNKAFLIWVDVQGAERQELTGKSIFNSAELLWIEYGESEYEEFLSREELINLFAKTHYVSSFSNQYKKGNLFFIKK